MAFLFDCSHKDTTFPITRRRKPSGASPADTYIVCLDCGREFPYSWEKMRVVRDPNPRFAALAGVAAEES